VEIKSNDDRSGILGFVTCALDQWMDRDAAITVEDIKPAADDTIIMCAPIWLQQLSSPPRTFIKQGKLKGMKMHLFITFGGKLNEEKQKLLETWVRDQGIDLQGVYGSGVGGKTPEDIKKQIDEYLTKAGLIAAVASSRQHRAYYHRWRRGKKMIGKRTGVSIVILMVFIVCWEG